MSKEILLVVDAVANEKGVAADVIFDAMEAALASAAKKRYSEDVAMREEVRVVTGLAIEVVHADGELVDRVRRAAYGRPS